MSDLELTYRQRLFVAAYLGEANGNASEAARMAGYAAPGIQGHENLKKPNICAAIDAMLADAAMSANEVLARLSDQASGDIGDFIDCDTEGTFELNLKKAKDAGRLHLIKKISHTKFGVSLELYDSQSALEKLGRYHKLFVDRQETLVSSNGALDFTEEQAKVANAKLAAWQLKSATRLSSISLVPPTADTSPTTSS